MLAMGHSRRKQLASLLAAILLAVVQADKDTDALQAVIDWVVSEGGQVNSYIGKNAGGVRGLFASKDLKAGDVIVSVPAHLVLNTGGYEDFSGPSLVFLKEYFNECSRFKPYFASFPPTQHVWNGCNLPTQYFSMLESKYWEEKLDVWQGLLDAVLTGEASSYAATLLPEAVGKRNVTEEELGWACALTATRYISGEPRKVLLMVPVFDMANHQPDCANYVRAYDGNDPTFHLVAGKALRQGEEVCYEYGDLRDDYAIAHYGFMVSQGEPRLATVDHPEFDDNADVKLRPTAFEGPPEAMQAEVRRLTSILDTLGPLEEAPSPPVIPGTEHIYAVLKSFQARRRAALQAEVQRLKGLLQQAQGSKDKVEL